MSTTFDFNQVPPAGNEARFGGRWRLAGAGLSNVWRYGDLELPAHSGRLLLRGPNGSGKTTALEALWPYLLDLNPALLSAGKARTTNLSGLMREGAEGRRRIGYLWLTFAAPDDHDHEFLSYGVRLAFSEGGSPPVRVTPFRVSGRPLHELVIYGTAREALTAEQFNEAVAKASGVAFDSDEEYVRDLAARLFQADARELGELAARIRSVRNPALLGEVSPRQAAEALRESLPGVAEDVITATAEALAESDATRDAFSRDRDAAAALDEFARVWVGHVVEVASGGLERARSAAGELRRLRTRRDQLRSQHEEACTATQTATTNLDAVRAKLSEARGRVRALESTETYRQAGRLQDLQQTLDAEQGRADADIQHLVSAAAASRSRAADQRHNLSDLDEDITALLQDVARADPAASPLGLFLSYADRPRGVLQVGDKAVDPGPGIVVDIDLDAAAATATSWRSLAQIHTRRSADAAILLRAHEAVASAATVSATARVDADRLARLADEFATKARDARAAAERSAATLCESVRLWTTEHHDLAAGETALEAEHGEAWVVDDVSPAIGEPGQILAATDIWAAAASRRAEASAARQRATAKSHDDVAEELEVRAGQLRRDASALRIEGAVLPLPRPEWAGAADDGRALGAALEWRDSVDENTQAVLEAALAAAGILGATVSSKRAETEQWQVRADGPLVPASLTEVLTVDTTHELADVVAQILRRIPLANTAVGGGLCVGRDGTFSAGALLARVPVLGAARHVGARRRRELALARADELESEATSLEVDAQVRKTEAFSARRAADMTLAAAAQFPSREALRSTEARRQSADEHAHESHGRALQAQGHAELMEAEAIARHNEWSLEAQALGLPADVGQLGELRRSGTETAGTIANGADRLAGKLTVRLRRTAQRADDDASADAELPTLHGVALASHRKAAESAETVTTLTNTAGTPIAKVLAEHKKTTARVGKLDAQAEQLGAIRLEAERSEANLDGQLETARSAADDALPHADAALAELRALFGVPGAADAVLDGITPADGDALLAQVSAAIGGVPRYAKKTARERADVTRASLAGLWSIDPGVDHPELDSYVLTHRDTPYTPVGAARHARTLAERAEAALKVSEESALRDFVIGRLPSAITDAWTRLHDWGTEVNRKMRTVAASSGVAVQVRISVSDGLDPVTRSVYESLCKSGEGLRSPKAKAEVGQALQNLIQAADGDDMRAQVAAAVDVRAWVDVTYQVTRPGAQPRAWTSRTGLSGGERRLVVLAPMLAAVAAAYDKFPAGSPRLTALDEVPAEVDEQGREGLARYLAELDLDLVCTSYLWDGAPGAWDGVDAFDLEAGPDGTVVAFPMLVRGLLDLPGDGT